MSVYDADVAYVAARIGERPDIVSARYTLTEIALLKHSLGVLSDYDIDHVTMPVVADGDHHCPICNVTISKPHDHIVAAHVANAYHFPTSVKDATGAEMTVCASCTQPWPCRTKLEFNL